jgi:hypothetical protein
LSATFLVSSSTTSECLDGQERLDYEGKIDRSAQNVEILIALGEASVETFLRTMIRRSQPIPILCEIDTTDWQSPAY